MNPGVITPDMLPAPRQPSLADHPAIRRLGKALPDALLRAFKSFGQLPIKVSLEAVTGETVMQDREDAPQARYRGAGATFGASIATDRALVHAYTELALGGDGLESPYAVDRPLSRIEEGLRRLLLIKLADAAAEPLKAALGALPCEGGEADNPETRAGGEARRFLVFQFLVNVSANDGELRIGLEEEGLRAVLSLQTLRSHPAPGPAALAASVSESLAILTVSLAEQELSVADLAALRPGGLLKLNATAAGPVKVWCGETPMFSATLARTGDHLAVRISA